MNYSRIEKKPKANTLLVNGYQIQASDSFIRRIKIKKKKDIKV